MADKHYAGRWICQKPLDHCNGRISVYGAPRPCPLAHVCKSLTHPRDQRGQLEYFYRESRRGRVLAVASPNWAKEHQTRYRAAQRAFAGEEVNAYHRGYRAAHADEINRRHREKYCPSMERLRLLPPPKTIPPPPCGGDCENCPWDDGCRYPNWDEEHTPKPRNREKEYACRKARIENDPDYAAKVRRQAREAQRRHRAKVKQMLEGCK